MKTNFENNLLRDGELRCRLYFTMKNVTSHRFIRAPADKKPTGQIQITREEKGHGWLNIG